MEKKRPQNVSRPWKIEYKNEDGHIFTYRGSYTTKARAVRAVSDMWLRDHAELDSDMVLKTTESNENYSIMSDGFHMYTVFNREAVVYS